MMAAHLLISTLVLAVALLGARSLPVTARTRHTILLLGLLSFCVPPVPLLPTFAQPNTAVGGGTMEVVVAAIRETSAPSSGMDGGTWLRVLWMAGAVSVGSAIALGRRRTAVALRNCEPAAPREREALAGVVGSRWRINIVRCEAFDSPVALGVLRHVIVVPHAAGTLSDDELRAVVVHEAAHVERRDNLAGGIVDVLTALLWFHPLVWVARAELRLAREAACDEEVVRRVGVDPYLRALDALCQSAVRVAIPGASCMSASHLRERIELMMKNATARTLPHASAVAVMVAIVGTGSLLSAATREEAGAASVDTGRYAFAMRAFYDPRKPKIVRVNLTVRDRQSGKIISQPTVETIADGSSFKTLSRSSETPGQFTEVRVEGIVQPDHKVVAATTVLENDVQVQRSELNSEASAEAPGERVTLNVKDAPIRDVLEVFAAETGMEVDIASEVKGTVTMSAKDVPWTEVLHLCVAQVGAKAEIGEGRIRIRK